MDEQVVRQYLVDALSDALLRLPGPAPLWLLLEALPPELRLSAETALSLLGGDPRFAPCETRWDLAHRADLADRPLGGTLETILQAHARPMCEALLLAELCLSKPGSPEDYRQLLERLLRTSREVGFGGAHYYLTRWLVNTSATEEQRLLYLNGLDQDQAFLKAARKLQAATLKGRTPLDTAEAVLKAYGQPLDNRALGLVLWRHHGDRFVATDVLSAMLGDGRFLALTGPKWITSVQARSLRKAVDKLRGTPASRPETVDLATILQSVPAQRHKLSEEEAHAVLHLAQRSRVPVALPELLADVLKIRPRQHHFGPAAHALEDLLSNDLRLLRLQRGEYLSRQAIPDWVRTVPPSLVPETLPLGPREVSPDLVLPLAELSPPLAEHVRAPFYEDQGETEVVASDEAGETTQVPIPRHHYHLGTMKLRLYDRRLFSVPGPINLVRFYGPDGVVLPVWVNTETRLLYGLLQWYHQSLHPTGSLVTIRRLPGELAYELAYNDDTDPGTYIGRERLAQLLETADRLRRRRAFLLDIITELLHQSEKGLAFDQLWAQVNIVRRTTRLQVASILSHYPRFTLATGGRWVSEKG